MVRSCSKALLRAIEANGIASIEPDLQSLVTLSCTWRTDGTRGIKHVARHMQPILHSDDWDRIQTCPQLARDVVCIVSQGSRRVTGREKIYTDAHLCVSPDEPGAQRR
ncbi:hypothetical protein BST61_g10943 [Cercospora zeina]